MGANRNNATLRRAKAVSLTDGGMGANRNCADPRAVAAGSLTDGGMGANRNDGRRCDAAPEA